MAKIAVALERALARRAADGTPGRMEEALLARGDGWTVEDVICTSGPGDRPFAERHSKVSIAIVAAGSFQYRAAAGRELMTPGSFLLGNAGQGFECGHEHGSGDRCLSFKYAPGYFEGLAADAGGGGAGAVFRTPRLPPLPEVSPLIALALAGLCGAADVSWEELGVQLAVRTIRLAGGRPTRPGVAAPAAVARVTRIVRTIEDRPDADLTLGSLAREAGLSSYHFLRIFERLTGTTPHQYVLRSRLRAAAIRLLIEPGRILDIAFDCGFGDVSNFNRAFRAEFGVSPRAYRLRTGPRPAPACSSP